MIDNPHFTVLTFKKDTYITVEGKADDHFFIIQQGKVQLSREGEVVKERDGNILGPGDFFGVVAALSSQSHIETTQAITDVTVMVIQKGEFNDFIQHNTQIAMHIILQFSNRVRYLTKGLTQLALDDTDEAEDVSRLFAVGTYYDKMEQYSHAYYAYHQYLKYCPEGADVPQAQERLAEISSYAKGLPFITNGNKRTYGEDTILYIQGEPGEELYVIQSGSIKITKIVSDNEILLSILKAGDIFGEMAILESKPRSVTAVTNEECTLIAVSRENFSTILGSNPQIIGRLMQSVAERIWFLYKHLSNIALADPIARVYDALIMQLEKNRIPLDSTEGYTFNFGLKDLTALIGLPEEALNRVLTKIKEDTNIQIVDDKVTILQVCLVTKEGSYYRNLEWRKKAFREK